jgi:hypothetical protein
MIKYKQKATLGSWKGFVGKRQKMVGENIWKPIDNLASKF